MQTTLPQNSLYNTSTNAHHLTPPRLCPSIIEKNILSANRLFDDYLERLNASTTTKEDHQDHASILYKLNSTYLQLEAIERKHRALLLKEEAHKLKYHQSIPFTPPSPFSKNSTTHNPNHSTPQPTNPISHNPDSTPPSSFSKNSTTHNPNHSTPQPTNPISHNPNSTPPSPFSDFYITPPPLPFTPIFSTSPNPYQFKPQNPPPPHYDPRYIAQNRKTKAYGLTLQGLHHLENKFGYFKWSPQGQLIE